MDTDNFIIDMIRNASAEMIDSNVAQYNTMPHKNRSSTHILHHK
jgi:hypothetical protein